MLLEETLEDGTEVTITDESFTTHMEISGEDMEAIEAKEIALNRVQERLDVGARNLRAVVEADSGYTPTLEHYNVIVMMNR